MFTKLFLSIILLTSVIYGQKDKPFIKTIKIENSRSKFSNTIHPLDSKITFSFDDITGNQDEYYYLITHCEIDWTPSELPVSYYIDGFNNFQVNNFENSFGTLQNYTHYYFTIPNENTQITKSGNYLFQILNEEDEIVCERKITLFQKKVTLGLQISESRDLENHNEKQAVSMILNTQNLKINYPNQEIKTFIFQNGDRQISSPYLQPTFTNQNSYTYRPTKDTEFLGGNEFYYFDNNEILSNSRFVAKSYRKDNHFYSVLFSKKSRALDVYTYNPDVNGNFLIRNGNNQHPDTEADYSNVQFTLLNSPDFENQEIYVYGAFNNFQFTKENKLHTDPTGMYLTTRIYLKQGFYNYDFVVKNNTIDKKTISGSFHETENNYESLVYFQPINSIYYSVVGYGLANSKQQIEN